MSDITVRALGEDEWDEYRSARLAALKESPEAFAATFEAESRFDEALWRERMRRSRRLLAQADGEAVGVVSIGTSGAEFPDVAELFGLWVTPAQRGHGVAALLVRAGARNAVEMGKTHLTYWVGSDNGRAVAFASSFGFRPTDTRRPMRVVSAAEGEEEIAMVLPLTEDRGSLPSI